MACSAIAPHRPARRFLRPERQRTVGSIQLADIARHIEQVAQRDKYFEHILGGIADRTGRVGASTPSRMSTSGHWRGQNTAARQCAGLQQG
jgi:hypothetical protein